MPTFQIFFAMRYSDRLSGGNVGERADCLNSFRGSLPRRVAKRSASHLKATGAC
ncbi:hypothetical protein HDF12_000413 [Edaphobacter lichenicola]|uniref:Uncharacterized protein n=2 Tax=Tunturiibacter TaxID=3154218 RepID=A0A7Y9NJP5_9BACT|nr:hypothetical protein [Edaphobacter lichenicola]NYF50048.1 hypothetical protein [Edaphobacter lichenicola]